MNELLREDPSGRLKGDLKVSAKTLRLNEVDCTFDAYTCDAINQESQGLFGLFEENCTPSDEKCKNCPRYAQAFILHFSSDPEQLSSNCPPAHAIISTNMLHIKIFFLHYFD